MTARQRIWALSDEENARLMDIMNRHIDLAGEGIFATPERRAQIKMEIDQLRAERAELIGE